MTAKILTLIDKIDTFELVRDEVAAILLVESTKQQELAEAEDPPKDPLLWKLRVFVERSNPWSEWLDAPPDKLTAPPIVNVAFDNDSIDLAASNLIERQKYSGTFNIDCYGYGVSAEAEEGHVAGDEDAAREVQRAVRLVRNILMAGSYTYLGMQGLVWRRLIQTRTMFQPSAEGRQVQHVMGARLALLVDFNEYSPQAELQTLELLSITVERGDTGEIYFTANYGEEQS